MGADERIIRSHYNILFLICQRYLVMGICSSFKIFAYLKRVNHLPLFHNKIHVSTFHRK